MEQANVKMDFKELWEILIKRKIFIFLLTILVTLGAVIYVMTTKPIYRGNVTLEVGEIINKKYIDGKYASLQQTDLDNIYTLKSLVSKVNGVSAIVPKKTKLLTMSTSSTEKNAIEEKLKKAISYVLNRHKEMAKLYSGQNAKVKMTQVIGKITVGNTAIKPKKKLIITLAFISSLLLSIFLAFFLEFIKGIRELEVKMDK